MNSVTADTNKKGKFIVFEGIDGSGKTTQIELLEKRLKADGRKVFRTCEPTSSTTGGMLRDALSGTFRRTACEMAALFVLDRIFHNQNEVNGIEKMLADGYDVICDRYYYSSMAYQGSETDMEWVMNMNLGCPGIIRPDACIFLDLSPEQSLERISQNRAFTEIYENSETLCKVRNNFHRVIKMLGKTENIICINAFDSIDNISDKVYAAVSVI